MNKHITILFDRPDYKKTLTDDPIINITGSVGSGKSTHGRKYSSNKYIIIGLDSVFGNKDPDTRSEHTSAIKELLAKKYGEDFQTEKKLKARYYNEIILYIESQNKTGVIEGTYLCDSSLIEILKGEIVIMRTAKIKCYYRSVIRDLNNPDWSTGLNIRSKLKRLIHVIKRRTKVFDTSKIEIYIETLEKYQTAQPKKE